jgi:C4-dicarboxylate-specific signal transduction histidine kinase
MRENQFKENAMKETSLATSKILNYLQIEQANAELLVSTLASMTSQSLEHAIEDENFIPSLLSIHLRTDLNLQSAGIWFEPYTAQKSKKDFLLFYNKDKNNTFTRVKQYMKKSTMNYRDMTFYTSGKKLKRGEIFWTNVYTDPVTDVRMITVESPIYKNHLFIGVASLDIAIKEHTKRLWSNLSSDEMYLMIIDREGTFIGKSSSVNPFTIDDNIYHMKNSEMHALIKTIEPSLRRYNHKTHYENNIKKEIYTINNDPVLHGTSIVATYHFPQTHWNIIIGILEDKVMVQQNETFKNVILIVIFLTLLATLLGYLILQHIFVKPIESINEQLKDNLSQDGLHHKLLTCNDNGEIGSLVENLNTRTQSLEAAKASEAKEIEKRIQNEKLLVQQSKMAAMGEMMDAVAHQWKQPLNALSMYSEIIKSDFDEGNVDKSYITQFSIDIQTQIDHMVNTLDEFRTFFRPNKENQEFTISDVLRSVLLLTKDDLLKNRITVKIEQEDPLTIIGSENEFKHLILNIINNAKDAFNERSIEKRELKIRIVQDVKGNRLEIEDNAGGIPEEIIKDIFKANVTSKDEGKGTGIGLYMSTQIASKHHATLSVKNQNNGACFTIKFLT